MLSSTCPMTWRLVQFDALDFGGAIAILDTLAGMGERVEFNWETPPRHMVYDRIRQGYEMSENDGKRPRVLVVEDEPTNIRVLTGVLGDDYTVTFAKTAKEALEMAAAQPKPDIILLDVLLPDMDGFMVCARLKANSVTATVPVIFVTMFDDQANEERGFRVGAADYVTKPIKPTTVRSRLRLHLRLAEHREFLQRLVDERIDEMKTTKEEALRLLTQLREDDAVRNP